MRNTNPNSLTPELRTRVLAAIEEARKNSLPCMLWEAARGAAAQEAIYAQGRETPEAVNAKRGIAGLPPIGEAEAAKTATDTPGSRHIGGFAADIVPVRNGLPWWNAAPSVWEKLGAIAVKNGLSWGSGGYGRVRGMGRANPHCELGPDIP